MIKVMHCISDTNFGGAGRVLLNYLNHFDANSFDVTVVVPKGSKLLDYFDTKKYRVVEFDGLYDRSYDRRDVKELVKVIKQYQPHIVHSHGALSARIAAKKCHKKIVYTRHSVFDLPKWQTSWFGKLLLGTINQYYTDRIIAVSPAAKDLLVSSGTKSHIIDVVFNGVERLDRASKEKCKQIKAQYGIEENDFVCTIMARLEAFKGHKYILEAARILNEQEIRNIKIIIAGTGEMENEIKDLVAAYNLENSVILAGFVTDISGILSITDVQLNASYAEATSMALLEGFSLGVPAIVSDYGGNPYVVTNEENGLIFSKNDAQTLAAAILRMKQDTALYQEAVAKSIETFDKKFTAQEMTKNMEMVYSQFEGEININEN